jgi:amidohydrolase
VVEGTVRCLDDSAWHAVPEMLKDLVESVASAYGVIPMLSYERSVPPVVNETVSTAMVAAAADRMLGPDAVEPAPQSLGGEDFAWYLESIPGSLFRLGTRSPGSVQEFDIHQPMFDVDERCIAVGVKVMAATALTAIGGEAGPDPVIAEVRAGRAGRIRAAGQPAEGVTLAGPLLARYSPVALP